MQQYWVRSGSSRRNDGRRETQLPLTIHQQNGVPVFDVPHDFPIITTEQVRERLEGE